MQRGPAGLRRLFRAVVVHGCPAVVPAAFARSSYETKAGALQRRKPSIAMTKMQILARAPRPLAQHHARSSGWRDELRPAARCLISTGEALISSNIAHVDSFPA